MAPKPIRILTVAGALGQLVVGGAMVLHAGSALQMACHTVIRPQDDPEADPVVTKLHLSMIQTAGAIFVCSAVINLLYTGITQTAVRFQATGLLGLALLNPLFTDVYFQTRAMPGAVLLVAGPLLSLPDDDANHAYATTALVRLTNLKRRLHRTVGPKIRLAFWACLATVGLHAYTYYAGMRDGLDPRLELCPESRGAVPIIRVADMRMCILFALSNLSMQMMLHPDAAATMGCYAVLCIALANQEATEARAFSVLKHEQLTAQRWFYTGSWVLSASFAALFTTFWLAAYDDYLARGAREKRQAAPGTGREADSPSAGPVADAQLPEETKKRN